MLRNFNTETYTARKLFFSNIINRNLNNARVLFSTIEKLTNPPPQLGPELISTSRCNELSSFFKTKMYQIRLNILSQTHITQQPEIITIKTGTVNLMSNFCMIDSETLEKTVQSLSSSTCTLDTLPTIFFKSVLHLLTPDLLKIINSSLETGIFPKSLKTAIIKLLLKKNNLDKSILSNYRPISNLPIKLLKKLFLIN